MENIIEKLYDIVIVVDSLEKNEKQLLLQEIDTQLNNINNNIILIKNKLLSLHLLKDGEPGKTQQTMDLNERRQYIVERSIFPYYWAINNRIYELDEVKLDEVEKKLDNGELFEIIKTP